ncbi:MAG: UDP-3-O-(3-hydroxymyristoyl)glucosamine N-acyltransferase [Deltaproteobacteria bacterium]|nr:UDP-3-O-(3-hydroxymyristoyl)glucosamine N-acyltransferase [Deltaproteobacteria bacterium]
MAVRKRLSEIAEHVGGTVVGDADVVVCDVRGIDEADEGDLTFIANPKYKDRIEKTRASAILVAPGVTSPGKNLIVTDDPYSAMAMSLTLLYPDEAVLAGTSDGACIEPDAEVGEGAALYPGVYVGRRARIGRGVILYPGVFVGDNASVGEGSILYPNVVVYRDCRIGNRVILHGGVVVGADGFGFANPGADNRKIPQVGIVQIDDDVEVGANTTIDRGTLGKTWIQKGVKIDNLVQIAHNVVIGENSIIVAQVGISGSTKLGESVILAGQVGVAGHITIGDNVIVGGQSGVHEDVPPNQMVSGSLHMPHFAWLRAQACMPHLPEMRKTVKALLKRIDQLEEMVRDKTNNQYVKKE